jgi:RNA polymerase sigma factor FliA
LRKSELVKRNKSITDHASLVEKIARRIVSRLPPNVELDDLKSAGFIGLIDAIEKFSDDKGTPFKVYAEIRIRGAIMDELRTQDWVPRSVRDRNQRLMEAERSLEERLGRKPFESELAKELDLTVERLRVVQSRAEIKSLLSIEDLNQQRNQHGGQRDIMEIISDPNQETPETQFERIDEQKMVARGMQKLKERQRIVVRLYYFEEMKLKEIGSLLNITESRVSQILSEGLAQLKIIIIRLQKG